MNIEHRLRRSVLLFFTAGAVASVAELDTVEALSRDWEVGFRNGAMVDPEASLEHCSAVAGSVPPKYAAAAQRGELRNMNASADDAPRVLQPPAATGHQPSPIWRGNA